jgi:NMD protein affecting ribosome stability and mRNA decay
MSRTHLCTKCGERQSKKSLNKGSSSWCQKCVSDSDRKRWNSLSYKQQREKWLKRKYKLTWDQYEDLWISQNKRCAICLTTVSIEDKSNSRYTACVDHCHTTGQVRGILCNHCNRALGLLKDNINAIQNMVNYLVTSK